MNFPKDWWPKLRAAVASAASSLAAHIAATGTSVHGLGTASTRNATDFAAATHADTHKLCGADEVGDIPLCGFVSRIDSTLSFNNSTRQFTIVPTGASFVVWGGATGGTKYTKTSTSITISNTAGLHFIYFDTSGNIAESTSAWDLLATNIPIAIVWWNGSTGRVWDERHSYMRSRAWHASQHATIGARYESGLALTEPASGVNSTIAVATGYIWDEDIKLTLTGPLTQALIAYRAPGGASMTFDDSASSTPYKLNVSSMRYDAAGTLTNVANGKYVTQHLYATNDTANPLMLVLGQAVYNTLAEAQAAPLPTLPIATAEWRLIYRLIYKQSGSTPTWIKTDDYRLASIGPVVAAVQPAGVLAVNVATDATQFTGLLSSTEINVQSALVKLGSTAAWSARRGL